jgi:hypothetical protein
VIALLILVVLLMLGVAALVYLLGFRLGGDEQRSELLRTKAEGLRAERQLHDLTRQAFEAMVRHAEERRRRST